MLTGEVDLARASSARLGVGMRFAGWIRCRLQLCCFLSALQIFMKESHPSVYKSGKGSTKEGLSLFGEERGCI